MISLSLTPLAAAGSRGRLVSYALREFLHIVAGRLRGSLHNASDRIRVQPVVRSFDGKDPLEASRSASWHCPTNSSANG